VPCVEEQRTGRRTAAAERWRLGGGQGPRREEDSASSGTDGEASIGRFSCGPILGAHSQARSREFPHFMETHRHSHRTFGCAVVLSSAPGPRPRPSLVHRFRHGFGSGLSIAPSLFVSARGMIRCMASGNSSCVTFHPRSCRCHDPFDDIAAGPPKNPQDHEPHASSPGPPRPMNSGGSRFFFR